jgi:hypothetical protein
MWGNPPHFRPQLAPRSKFKVDGYRGIVKERGRL